MAKKIELSDEEIQTIKQIVSKVINPETKLSFDSLLSKEEIDALIQKKKAEVTEQEQLANSVNSATEIPKTLTPDDIASVFAKPIETIPLSVEEKINQTTIQENGSLSNVELLQDLLVLYYTWEKDVVIWNLTIGRNVWFQDILRMSVDQIHQYAIEIHRRLTR